MHTRWKISLALAIALVSLRAHSNNSAGASKDPDVMRLERAAQVLESRVDADSLAAAALLHRLNHRSLSSSLIERATSAAPQRADLLWLQIQLCYGEASCDLQTLESRLRSLDAANGAGWVGALSRADLAHDEQGRFAALEALGRSERLDIYWTTLVARLSRATAETKAVTLLDAEVSVIGILAAQAIPAYSVLSNACKGEPLQRDDLLQACRGVANALQHGDSYITEMVGNAIAKRVWPEDSPQWHQAAEARRTYQYRATFLNHSEAWNAAHTDEYLTLCAQNRREQDLFKAELSAMGKDPDPPPEWVSGNP